MSAMPTAQIGVIGPRSDPCTPGALLGSEPLIDLNGPSVVGRSKASRDGAPQPRQDVGPPEQSCRAVMIRIREASYRSPTGQPGMTGRVSGS